MSAESSTCNTCRFYQAGDCHRHPPTWALWPADNQHPIMYSPYAAFPHVSPSDWCGEHQLSDALKEKDAPSPTRRYSTAARLCAVWPTRFPTALRAMDAAIEKATKS